MTKKSRILLMASVPLAIFSGACNNANKQDKFLDLAGIDSTASPAQDFFQYANGKWYKSTTIPSDQKGWGSFYILSDDNLKKLHGLLEDAGKNKNAKAGSLEQKLGDLYASAMDSATIDAAGYNPVKSVLARIDNIKTPEDIIKECANTFNEGNDVMFGLFVGPDDRNVQMNITQFFQSGLFLPSKEHYFSNDSTSRHIRSEFLKYMTNIYKNIGYDTAAAGKMASDVMQLQTALAKSHLTPVELRDPIKNYHKFAVTQLDKSMPTIGWSKFLSAIGVHADSILVGQPAYYQEFDKQLKAAPLETWKNMLKLAAVQNAPLGKPFDELKFDFYSRTISGQKERSPRWKRVTNNIDHVAGDLLGQLFVEKYFPADAKKRMLDLVNNLQAVYEKRIKALDWMSNTTKEKALVKLHAFTKKIGYPDKWKDYSSVDISKDYFKNMQNLSIFEFKRAIAKIGKPVDRTEWDMTAPTVNAYYNPTQNEIVFPAGILQPPFFNNSADDAINYGAIGAVIGHEMTHGFDDQGRQYDAEGNLKDWWTKEDADKFNQKTKLVVDQYNQFKVLDSLHVNGELTLGENIADIGGLAIAYEAFKNTPQGKSNEKIDGLTADERFFLSFANIWRVKDVDAFMRQRLLTDPHSPEQCRINGTLSNTLPFYNTFGIKPGDKMYRADSIRVNLW